MSITKLSDGSSAEFRYEGRFPYGKGGDGIYFSNHTRVLVSGPYSFTTNTFASITSGQGYEASMYGNSSGALNAGGIHTFMANATGIGAKSWNLTASAAITGSVSTWGSTPNTYSFTASASEKVGLLTTDISAFTSASACVIRQRILGQKVGSSPIKNGPVEAHHLA